MYPIPGKAGMTDMTRKETPGHMRGREVRTEGEKVSPSRLRFPRENHRTAKGMLWKTGAVRKAAEGDTTGKSVLLLADAGEKTDAFLQQLYLLYCSSVRQGLDMYS